MTAAEEAAFIAWLAYDDPALVEDVANYTFAAILRAHGIP